MVRLGRLAVVSTLQWLGFIDPRPGGANQATLENNPATWLQSAKWSEWPTHLDPEVADITLGEFVLSETRS